MLGPFPWYYSRDHVMMYDEEAERYPIQRDDKPKWNEERGNWNEWRLRIPPEWRFRALTDAPDSLKEKLGLMSYEYRHGDPDCEFCKSCRVYKTCKFNGMMDQSNCATHQLWCRAHPDKTDPQTQLSEFYDHPVISQKKLQIDTSTKMEVN